MGVILLNKPSKPLTPKHVQMKIKEEQEWKKVEQQFKQYLKTNNLNPSSENEECLMFEDFLLNQ